MKKQFLSIVLLLCSLCGLITAPPTEASAVDCPIIQGHNLDSMLVEAAPETANVKVLDETLPGTDIHYVVPDNMGIELGIEDVRLPGFESLVPYRSTEMYVTTNGIVIDNYMGGDGSIITRYHLHVIDSDFTESFVVVWAETIDGTDWLMVADVTGFNPWGTTKTADGTFVLAHFDDGAITTLYSCGPYDTMLKCHFGTDKFRTYYPLSIHGIPNWEICYYGPAV